MIKRGISIFQIVILLLGFIAFNLLLGEELKLISALNLPDEGYQKTSIPDVYRHPDLPEDDPHAYWNSKTDKFGNRGLASIWAGLDGKTTTTNSPTKAPGFFGSIYGFNEGKGLKDANFLAQGGYTDAIVSAAAWGMTAYGIAKFAGGMFFDDESTTNAFAMAAGFGALAGSKNDI